MDLYHYELFFLSSERILQSAVYKRQVCLSSYILLLQKKQSHCTDQHRLMAHRNLPGRQSKINDQCVSISLQRSMQCHLQCTSMFGSVAPDLFQTMKWSSWLSSLHGIWLRYKERLLFQPEGTFDANAVDQQGAIIILSQNLFFIVGINWFPLHYQLFLLDSAQRASKARSKQPFWVYR